MAESVLCVRWTGHTSELATAFTSFLENNSFVDCILSAEGQSLQAHRLVLSACSPYFHKLFCEETENHPFIVVLDESFQTLKAMIDFIYRGELQIPRGNLTEFLTLAQNLEIKGLNAFAQKNNLPGSTTDNVHQDPSVKTEITNEDQEDSSENKSQKTPHHFVGNTTNSPVPVARSTSAMTPSQEQRRPQGALIIDIRPPLNAVIPEARNELQTASVGGDTKILLLFSRADSLGPVCNQATQEQSTKQSKTPASPGSLAGANPKDKRSHTCDVCGAIFTSLTGLIVHNRKHTGERPYLCDVCGVSFVSKHHLTCHLRLHTGERPYTCDYCGKTFRQKSNLNLHLPLHTGVLPHKCTVCGKTFIQKQLYTEHMRLHTGERPHRCDVCGVTYRRLNTLRVHKQRHTGERPHRCDVCGKTFRQKSGLKAHMPLHTGKRPYSCETCGKTFAYKPSLIVHQRSHTGERPYCCDVCGKTFALKGGLVVHTRTHTGERPYRCDVCGVRFAQQCGLNYHKRTHQTVEPS